LCDISRIIIRGLELDLGSRQQSGTAKYSYYITSVLTLDFLFYGRSEVVSHLSPHIM